MTYSWLNSHTWTCVQRDTQYRKADYIFSVIVYLFICVARSFYYLPDDLCILLFHCFIQSSIQLFYCVISVIKFFISNWIFFYIFQFLIKILIMFIYCFQNSVTILIMFQILHLVNYFYFIISFRSFLLLFQLRPIISAFNFVQFSLPI